MDQILGLVGGRGMPGINFDSGLRSSPLDAGLVMSVGSATQFAVLWSSISKNERIIYLWLKISKSRSSDFVWLDLYLLMVCKLGNFDKNPCTRK